MPTETMQAIVLRHADYRDFDRMVTLLSPTAGRVDALARGCRRPKNALLPASELFTHGEFVLYRKGEQYTLTSCEITDAFYPLRLDTDRLCCGAYLLELAGAAAQPDQPAMQLYATLLQGLYRLSYTEAIPRSVVSSFLLLYASIIGYKPRLNHCALCRRALDTSAGAYLSPQAGGLLCAACSPGSAQRLSAEQILWMRRTLAEGMTDAQQKTDASEALPTLRRYVEFRLDRDLKSSRFL